MDPVRNRNETAGPFDDVIPDLYDAVLDPQAWPRVLARIADAAGVDSVDFLVAGKTGQAALSEVSARIPSESRKLYRDYYGAISPRRNVGRLLPVGEFFVCHKHFDDAFVRRDEFYNDFCIPMGFRYLASVTLVRERDYEVGVGFQRELGHEPFSGRDTNRLAALLPHLTRIARLQRHMSGLMAGERALAETFDRLSSGVIIVDAGGCIRYSNRSADTLLQAGDGIGLRKQRLIARDEQINRKLARLIADAIAWATAGRSTSDQDCVETALAVPCQHDNRPIVLSVVSLPPFSASHFWRSEPSAAIYVEGNKPRQPTAAEHFASLFGLTPAEARLAAWLATGSSLAEAADAFGLSKNTLRVQLAGLMKKTDTHRQSALVHLLMRSPSAPA